MLQNSGPEVISQDEDFLAFSIDGVVRQVDVAAAHRRFAQIDVAHDGDPWFCYKCRVEWRPSRDELNGQILKCPTCGDSQNIDRDPGWLKDVAAYVVSLGWERCGEKAAGAFYSAIVRHVEDLKKNGGEPPVSASGTE